MSAQATRSPAPLGRILVTVLLTFLGYAAVGLPLAVLPSYVANDLGFGAPLAGLTIGTQYLATVLSRSQVGQMSDRYGPKRAAVIGFVGCLGSGLLTTAAAGVAAAGRPELGLGLLLVSRLALGVAESWVSTGAITWAMGELGPEHMVRIISWNGIATYSALALGAPAGAVVAQGVGVAGLGLICAALGLLGLVLTIAKPGVPPILSGARMPMRRVVARVLPFGAVLALAASGFGVMATFVTLFFASRHWAGAPLCLTLFGAGFIAARLILGDAIVRLGGLRMTAMALCVEIAGLLAVWLAPSPLVAILGAGVAGFGFSPIFPALGSVAVGRVPPENRGAAIGLFSMFLDVALGLTGPVAGLLVEQVSPAAPFGLGVATGLAALGGVALMLLR